MGENPYDETLLELIRCIGNKRECLFILEIFYEGYIFRKGPFTKTDIARALEDRYSIRMQGAALSYKLKDILNTFEKVGIIEESYKFTRSGYKKAYFMNKAKVELVNLLLRFLRSPDQIKGGRSSECIEDALLLLNEKYRFYDPNRESEIPEKFDPSIVIMGLFSPKVRARLDEVFEVIKRITKDIDILADNHHRIDRRKFRSWMESTLEEINPELANRYRRAFPSPRRVTLGDGREAILNMNLIRDRYRRLINSHLPRDDEDALLEEIFNHKELKGNEIPIDHLDKVIVETFKEKYEHPLPPANGMFNSLMQKIDLYWIKYKEARYLRKEVFSSTFSFNNSGFLLSIIDDLIGRAIDLYTEIIRFFLAKVNFAIPRERTLYPSFVLGVLKSERLQKLYSQNEWLDIARLTLSDIAVALYLLLENQQAARTWLTKKESRVHIFLKKKRIVGLVKYINKISI